MKTFDDLVFKDRAWLSGEGAAIEFPNKYGVSVIRGEGTYGYSRGLFELGILYGGDLCYNTDITSDVIGHLSPDEITDIMKKVQELGAD